MVEIFHGFKLKALISQLLKWLLFWCRRARHDGWHTFFKNIVQHCYTLLGVYSGLTTWFDIAASCMCVFYSCTCSVKICTLKNRKSCQNGKIPKAESSAGALIKPLGSLSKRRFWQHGRHEVKKQNCDLLKTWSLFLANVRVVKNVVCLSSLLCNMHDWWAMHGL